MPNSTFPKRLRLLRPTEFEHVFSSKNSASNSWIVLYAAPNDLEYPRLGLTVSRKAGGSVERNRWKRILREGFRLSQQSLPAVDLICMPRGKTPPALSEIQSSFVVLAGRLDRQLRKSASKAPRTV
jgi:ribonuclease P protein component